MKVNLFILFIAVSGLFVSCGSSATESSDNDTVQPANGVHKVTVEEVIQTSTYTYLRVKENGTDFWVAISKSEVEKGGTYYFDNEIEMKDFESKELNKTFESIFFVDNFRDKPEKEQNNINLSGDFSHGVPNNAKTEINVTKAEGGITIQELFANKEEYAGKTVKIKGKIVKVNSAIMGKNWVHLQDGTSYEDKYDLTITTLEEHNKDDVVTFEGIITLDKDFGAGYFYDVIMEDGKALK